ncbi:MAG: hypothetical protein EOO48_01645 [Flavobacterium sp.]|nr:MAG: hypothetical protein EOO48_01645 [Flavobacterium sp.]
MKTHFLFPRRFKVIGWLLFVPAFLAAIYFTITGGSLDSHFTTSVFAVASDEFLGKTHFMHVIENSVSDEILLSMMIIGGLFVGFSRLKDEDELIAKIRYESLVWAVYVNFAIMLFATVFIYGMFFFNVMIANMFTVLLFFIIRFHLMLYKLNKSAGDEK